MVIELIVQPTREDIFNEVDQLLEDEWHFNKEEDYCFNCNYTNKNGD